MEYGLRIATPESDCRIPEDVCRGALLKLFPQVSFSSLYFGSEFCQELLPGIRQAESFCELARDRGLEPVLLTPLVTHKGLRRVARLLGRLTLRGWTPSVVFNDWGVFELVHSEHPTLRLRMGRLMNRGLRDPRLDFRTMKPVVKNTGRGAGLRKLASSLGVHAVETDADLEPGYLGTGADGMERTLHVPYTFVSSGRNCLERAAATPDANGRFTHGLASGCKAPCRAVCRREHRPDVRAPMWRAGNTVFFEAPVEWISNHMELADRVVFHERPIP